MYIDQMEMILLLSFNIIITQHLHDLMAVYNKYKLSHNVSVAHCYGDIHVLRLLDVIYSKEKVVQGVAAVVFDLGVSAPVSLGLVGKLPSFMLGILFSGGYRHCEGGGLVIIIARGARENFSPRLLLPLGHAHKTLAIARLSNRNAVFRHFLVSFCRQFHEKSWFEGLQERRGAGGGLGLILVLKKPMLLG